MVTELIGKYVWLIQTISAAGSRGLPMKDIAGKYERRFSQEYSRRTFNNHRLAIEEVFGIEILCDRSTNCYFIPFSEDALDNESSISWLIDTFTVNNLLTMSKERLTGRVSVEEIPSGRKYLTAVMQAMEESREIEIEYRKYSSATSETFHLQPFAVKEHERRWYLVAYCRERASAPGGGELPNSDPEAWRVYGLDRILSLRETGRQFRMPRGFDVDEIFARSFGIFFPKPGQKSVLVRFRATASEAGYLRDLPLHRSQTEEGRPDSEGRVVFRLRVIPDKNLVMEFCRLGDRVEVLDPQDLRKAVAEELEKASKQYR